MSATNIKTVLAVALAAVLLTSAGLYLSLPPAVATPLSPSLQDERTVIFVAAAHDGIVRRVLVQSGQQVQEGDLLAELDSRLAAASLETAKAHLTAANAQLDASRQARADSERQLERTSQISRRVCLSLDEMILAQIPLDRDRAGVTLAEHNVALAEQEIKQAAVLLATHQVRSPSAGIVKAITKRAGEGVQALGGVVELTVAQKPARR